MKNWDKLEADENLILDKHYTPGRAGKIDKVVIHHNAGNLTIRGCYNVWQDREASAHYQVQSDGRIGQLVWDRDTAWHAGDANANATSIGIEHADCQANPWMVSNECLENGAHLVAAICKYYGLGRPQWLKNVFPHSYFSSTECPASLNGTQNATYMRRAQAYYDAMTKGGAVATPAPSKPASKPSTDLNAIADAVIRGEYGNGDERKRKLGSNYNAVMAIVNKKLGVSSAPAKPAKKTVDQVAQEVINGSWGNGEDRKRRLQAAGYDYNAVQNAVNAKLSGGSHTQPVAKGPSLDDVARAVIRGDYGNGDERRRRLEAAGFNYNAVQARVNQML